MKDSRPYVKQTPPEIRTKGIKIALSQEEDRLLRALSAEIGIPRANLMRSMVLEYADRMLVSIPRTLGTLDALGGELGHLAIDVKKILELHTLGRQQGDTPTFDTLRVATALEAYVSLQRKVDHSLRALIRLIRRKS